MNKSEFEKDLEFDKHKLDEVWENHSYLYFKWAEKWVESVYDRDRAKENVDVVKAEVAKDVRDFPGEYDLAKVTESAITAAVNLDIRVRKAIEELNQANKEVNILSVAKEAMGTHRKKAIESETQLWISGYYSDPKVSNKAQDKSNEKVRKEEQDGLESNPRLKNKNRRTRRK